MRNLDRVHRRPRHATRSLARSFARLIALLAVWHGGAQAARGQGVIFQDGFEECGLGHWSHSTDPLPPERFSGVTAGELADALGACSPSLLDASYRLADGSLPSVITLSEMQELQASILNQFGTGGITALAGGSVAVLSSGRARDMDSPDWIDPNGGTRFARPGLAPPGFLAAHGGVLPQNPVCGTQDAGANDAIALRLVLQVPPAAQHLVFSFLFASANWPEFNCSVYDDYFLAIATGSSPLLPPDRNVALDVGGPGGGSGGPVSTGYVVPDYCNGCPGGAGALAGTGFGADAMTGWRQASVPVVPGETLTLDLMVFDAGDDSWDTLVLIDDLRWERF
jgi:hypothetical protein